MAVRETAGETQRPDEGRHRQPLTRHASGGRGGDHASGGRGGTHAARDQTRANT